MLSIMLRIDSILITHYYAHFPSLCYSDLTPISVTYSCREIVAQQKLAATEGTSW